MEGKAVLFKKFAGVDCFDIEVNETDPEKLADLVCRLEPTFGAVNLEDIKAPDCFFGERICRERMGIPVFHDDQHGTAIVAAAATTNALRVADTHVNIEPAGQQLADTMVAAARHVGRFGLTPKLTLCSGSQFGNLDSHSGRVAREALGLLDSQDAQFQYEGVMHTDAALDPELRERLMPNNRLDGKANMLIYTNTDAAGAARNLLKSVADGLEVGPILMGMGMIPLIAPKFTMWLLHAIEPLIHSGILLAAISAVMLNVVFNGAPEISEEELREAAKQSDGGH